MSESAPPDRFEDVFQDEIVRLIPQDEFKEFARSSSGLCLSALEVDEIVHDYPKESEQKIQLLFKWKFKNPDATPDTIRRIARKFLAPDFDEEFGDEGSETLTETIRIYPNKQIGARDFILEGKQKTHRGARKLAIKLLTWDEETQREADILLDLEGHHNIVLFVSSGKTKQGFITYLYIAMELCHQYNLFEHINRRDQPFSSMTAYSHASQLTCGLHYMHGQNTLHRDLKPHNVLLSLDLKKIKIADFGLSKTVNNDRSSTASNSRSWIGTNGYRSPEAYNYLRYKKEGDIFSLGLVVYFIWSNGKHPFGADPDEWSINIKRYIGVDLTQLELPQQDHSKAQLFLEQLLCFEEQKRPDTSKILDWINTKGLTQKFDEFEMEQLKAIAIAAAKLRSPRPRICIFITTSETHPQSLCSLDPSDQPEPYQEVNLEKIIDIKKFGRNSFSAVTVGETIYLLTWIGYTYVVCPRDGDEVSWKKLDNETHFLHGRWPAAAVMKDHIYVCGGGWDEARGICEQRNLPYIPASANCEVYDTIRDKWHPIAEMHDSRRYHAVVACQGVVYAIGGADGDGKTLKSTEKYDPATEKWVKISSLNTERLRAAAVAFNDTVYILGGKNIDYASLSDIEAYDPKTDVWTVLINKMTVPRSLFRACVCDSKLYAVAGDASGVEEFPVNTSIEMWDPATEEGWKKYKPLQVDLETSGSLVFVM